METTVTFSSQDCLPPSSSQQQAMSFKTRASRNASHGASSFTCNAKASYQASTSSSQITSKGILPCPNASSSRQVRRNSARNTLLPRLPAGHSPLLKNNRDIISKHFFSSSAVSIDKIASVNCKTEKQQSHAACCRTPFKLLESNSNRISGVLTSEKTQSKSRKKKVMDPRVLQQRGRKTGAENLSCKVCLPADKEHGLLKVSLKSGDRSMYNNSNITYSSERTTDDRTPTEVVTILRRPKNDDAAVEQMAKFFNNAVLEEDIQAAAEETMFALSSDDSSRNDMNRDSKLSSESDSLSDEGLQFSSPLSRSERLHAAYMTTGLVSNGEFGASSGLDMDLDRSIVNSSPSPDAWERWAGPSFINSPPPSALPMPRFSKKDDMASAYQIINQISATASRTSSLQQSDTVWDAVDIATSNLKRMLNLDVCRTLT